MNAQPWYSVLGHPMVALAIVSGMFLLAVVVLGNNERDTEGPEPPAAGAPAASSSSSRPTPSSSASGSAAPAVSRTEEITRRLCPSLLPLTSQLLLAHKTRWVVVVALPPPQRMEHGAAPVSLGPHCVSVPCSTCCCSPVLCCRPPLSADPRGSWAR
jgi:hypothetical protein